MNIDNSNKIANQSVTILGIAIYPKDKVWENVEYLVRSARNKSVQSDILLITSELGIIDRRKFNFYNVRYLELCDVPPLFDRNSQKGKEFFLKWLKSIWILRHDYYIQAFSEITSTHVLLTDTRDVIITGDLSIIENLDALLLSQEDINFTLSTEPHNRDWISNGYGEEVMQSLSDRPILCAGTVFGTKGKIIDYIKSIKNEIQRIGLDKAQEIGDQPIHNYLAYKNLLPEYKISTAENGNIKSIGIMESKSIKYLCKRSTDKNHIKTLVLHQYDRHNKVKKLQRLVKKSVGIRWFENISNFFSKFVLRII
jgi:hypothetical protein